MEGHHKHKTLLVLSGKGGVGKSTCAVKLARALLAQGKRVALLDVDLCGPSIAHMLGLSGQGVTANEAGWWIPVRSKEGLLVMSIAFLASDSRAPVVWRGPKKTSVINQFIKQVAWGDLDFLVVDTPPGTSDEHLAVVEALPGSRGVLITTPQNVSLGDVRREITFCRKTGVEMLGLFENMSGFVCPHCAECTNIFSSGGGEKLAEKAQIPFLGRIPIVPDIADQEQGLEAVQALAVKLAQ